MDRVCLSFASAQGHKNMEQKTFLGSDALVTDTEVRPGKALRKARAPDEGLNKITPAEVGDPQKGNTAINILIVEDSPNDAALLVRELRRAGFDPKWKRVEKESDFLAELRSEPDIILSDHSMPEFSGLRAVKLLEESGLEIPFILVSGTVGEDVAVEAMQHGATDYLLKDRIGRLGIAVERGLEQKRLRDQRNQKEEELLKAGALQSAIFNSANFSSIATDAKGVIQIFNVGAERMLGYTAAEVMNKITPADISDPQEVIARARALSVELGAPITPGFEALVFKASRGIEDIYELTYIRKDKSRFPAVVSVTALRDAQNGIIGYLLIGTDNTVRQQIEAERMRLDQSLRDQQFYTRSLIESSIDALITTDPQGIITDVNKQMEALTACTRDELIGAPFKNCFTDPERAEAGIKLVLGERKVTDYELTAHARNGRETVVSFNATTFYDRERKLQGVVVAARDVTERKRFEQALQASLADRELLLREIHHRVKNNMQLVCSLLQLQARQLQNPEMSAILHGSQTRVRSMALIHEKLYGGDSLARIDLADYLRSLAAMIQRSQSERAGVALRFELVPLTAGMDTAVPLGLAINELLTNAFKHAFPASMRTVMPSPEIVIALQAEEDGRLRLEVRDNGVGLPAHFAPEGNGSLGMRLVQIFAKQLRCELVWSSGSGGSVFQMCFQELKPKRPQPNFPDPTDPI
jgi:PAS domain S-box-containing protein